MLRSIVGRFQWKGSGHVYSLPWLRNRLEYSADPARVKQFLQSGKVTRSQLTRDMLSRFHLSHDSIVVSDDEHARRLRSAFMECLPPPESHRAIARALVDAVLVPGSDGPLRLSRTLIPAVYQSLLANLLGAHVMTTLREHIESIDFEPGTRPMHLDGLMYAAGLQFPGFGFMRKLIDFMFFRNDHRTRKIADRLERMVGEFATPKPGSWYAQLIAMKQDGTITRAQFRGELTSMLVSSYALSAALSAMLLCLAARPDYIGRIRADAGMAKHFVSEVLRLYPPFRQFGYEESGIWKKAGRPKDAATDFMVSVFGLHRNEAAWPDADEFRPERFAAADAAKGCKYMPFGLGKRACTGRTYSLAMMVEMLLYVCSPECAAELTLAPDFVHDYLGLPLGTNGRLVSFPVDDRIHVRRAPHTAPAQP